MSDQAKPRFKRVLVKLSGEALMGSQPFGIAPAVVRTIATELTAMVRLGVQVSAVVGGGTSFVVSRPTSRVSIGSPVTPWGCWRR
jgi:uridylate kinase